MNTAVNEGNLYLNLLTLSYLILPIIKIALQGNLGKLGKIAI
jgi:hypothetical protein